MLSRAKYLLAQALSGLWRSLGVASLSVGIIGFALSVFALFALLIVNLQSVANQISEQAGIAAQFDPKTPVTTQREFHREVSTWPAVKKAELITSTAAMDWLRINLGMESEILEGLPPDLLPPSIEIELHEINAKDLKLLVSKLEANDKVQAVQFGQDEVHRIHETLKLIRRSTYFFGVFLCLAVLLILSNAIRLAVYARKDEIEVMSLIGGTRRFIAIPFVIEGALLGALGGLFSIVLLLVFRQVFIDWLRWGLSSTYGNLELWFLDAPSFLALLLLGITIGLIASTYSALRYIKI